MIDCSVRQFHFLIAWTLRPSKEAKCLGARIKRGSRGIALGIAPTYQIQSVR